ncbi:MAG TPA: DUF2071 domain-containing protein [Actinomycetes bacterium]|jgi:uncharacterized protein|nr:DUF2071 domain-containing protein [Actinomycetes bacterium]
MDAPPAPPVSRPLMLHRWSAVTFLHWPYRPEVVQRLLPQGLEVETADGMAWVGLVPFRMEDVRLPGLPPLPWASRFPETNVRTYVRDASGRPGIWFFSLDAARLGAVVAARVGYGLPYFWSAMSVRLDGDRVSYRSRRRRPGPPGVGCRAVVQVEAASDQDAPGALDHFLTARFRLYTVIAGRIAYADAEHPAWSLTGARLLDLEDDLVAAAGLPRPDQAPLVHYSPGVQVRIGRWRFA